MSSTDDIDISKNRPTSFSAIPFNSRGTKETMQFSHPLKDVAKSLENNPLFKPSTSPLTGTKDINPPPLPPQHQLSPPSSTSLSSFPSLPGSTPTGTFPPFPLPPPFSHPFRSPLSLPPPLPSPPNPPLSTTQNVPNRLQPLRLRLLDPDRGHAQAVRADQAANRRPAPARVLPRLPGDGAAEQVQELDDGLHGAFWVSSPPSWPSFW